MTRPNYALVDAIKTNHWPTVQAAIEDPVPLAYCPERTHTQALHHALSQAKLEIAHHIITTYAPKIQIEVGLLGSATKLPLETYKVLLDHAPNWQQHTEEILRHCTLQSAEKDVAIVSHVLHHGTPTGASFEHAWWTLHTNPPSVPASQVAHALLSAQSKRWWVSVLNKVDRHSAKHVGEHLSDQPLFWKNIFPHVQKRIPDIFEKFPMWQNTASTLHSRKEILAAVEQPKTKGPARKI